MSEKSGIKNIFTKNRVVFIVLAVIGIALIIIPGVAGERGNDSAEYTDVGFYTEYLESRICELCKSINGITEATVFLTLDCSSEYVYEKEDESGASDFLILSGSGGENAVMLYEIYPRVRGIAVVCTGGDLPRIQESVTSLLSAALGISSGKIKVVGS